MNSISSLRFLDNLSAAKNTKKIRFGKRLDFDIKFKIEATTDFAKEKSVL